MVASRELIIGGAVVTLYFGLLGVKAGFIVLLTVISAITGERRGSSTMPRKAFLFNNLHLTMSLVFLSLLMVSALVSGDQPISPSCSRERSKQARAIINKVVAPLYALKHMEMPNSCPLSPANDRFAAEEVMKRRFGNKWMCSVCSKQFSDEEKLESHLSEVHPPSSRIEGCLADLCDILRCDAYFNINHNPTCDQEKMQSLRNTCMKMVSDDCMPDYLDTTRKLNFEVAVQTSMCTYLTCDNYWSVPDDDHEEYSYYYLTHAALIGVLVVFLFIYFKIATSNIDQSLSIEQILATTEQLNHENCPLAAPVSPDMEMRHRLPRDREWSEME